MKRSNRSLRRVFFMSATVVAAAALTIAGVTTSAVGAQSKPHAGPSQIGPGYPPPGGIYTSFTNCPLYNQLMHESVGFTACTAGLATSGSITLGNIVTPVVRPVNVQFGFWDGVNQTYYADVVPPPAGVSAILATKPDLIPESLTTALGCPSSNQVVENLCVEGAELRRAVSRRVRAGRGSGPDHELQPPQLDAAGDVQADQPAAGQQLHHRDDRRPGRAQPDAHHRQRVAGNRPAPENAPGHLRPGHPVHGQRHHVLGARRQRLRARRCEEHRG